VWDSAEFPPVEVFLGKKKLDKTPKVLYNKRKNRVGKTYI
jgi:hypothetical protein